LAGEAFVTCMQVSKEQGGWRRNEVRHVARLQTDLFHMPIERLEGGQVYGWHSLKAGTMNAGACLLQPHTRSPETYRLGGQE
jgi:hypothetical protein